MRLLLLLIVGCSVSVGEDIGSLMASAINHLAAISNDETDPGDLPVGAPKLPTPVEGEEIVKTASVSHDEIPGCIAIAPDGDLVFASVQRTWGRYVASSATPLSCLKRLRI
jgi:hypothetical protein